MKKEKKKYDHLFGLIKGEPKRVSSESIRSLTLHLATEHRIFPVYHMEISNTKKNFNSFFNTIKKEIALQTKRILQSLLNALEIIWNIKKETLESITEDIPEELSSQIESLLLIEYFYLTNISDLMDKNNVGGYYLTYQKNKNIFKINRSELVSYIATFLFAKVKTILITYLAITYGKQLSKEKELNRFLEEQKNKLDETYLHKKKWREKLYYMAYQEWDQNRITDKTKALKTTFEKLPQKENYRVEFDTKFKSILEGFYKYRP